MDKHLTLADKFTILQEQMTLCFKQEGTMLPNIPSLAIGGRLDNDQLDGGQLQPGQGSLDIISGWDKLDRGVGSCLDITQIA